MGKKKAKPVSPDVLAQLNQQFTENLRVLETSLAELMKVGEDKEAWQERHALFVTAGGNLVATLRRIIKLDGESGKKRLLCYLKANLGKVVDKEDLALVAGISDWPRRVRELDVEDGYNITTHNTDSALRPGQYRLESLVPDTERAEWWRFKKDLRKDESLTVHEKIIALLKKRLGKAVDGAEINYVSNIQDWPRRLRELRQEAGGWQISSYLNRADLTSKQYVLESDEELPTWDRVNSEVWKAVLKRDAYRCQDCGWAKSDPPSAGRRYLEVHHKRHVAQQGKPVPENLETLCNRCHDARHAEERQNNRR